MILLAHQSLSIEHKRHWNRPVAYPICQSACVYCGKTAEWIRMPFAVVSGVGQGMSVLDGVVIVEGERAVLRVNLCITSIAINAR